MTAIRPICAVLAFLCFLLAAFGTASRINLTALGLTFLTVAVALP